jgi:hypothetical protein
VSRDHPALQDIVAAMRPYAADPVPYDAFVKQWFEDKAMPEYRLANASKRKNGAGYDVTAVVKNVGTGTMPVTIAATAGERWKRAAPKAATGPGTAQAAPLDDKASGALGDAAKAMSGSGGSSEQDPRYREARSTVTLGAGESRTVTIHCDFPPEKLVVDPDVQVLQLRRKQAVAKL